MIEIAIIADDLTGALDTGIKFINRGMKAQIFLDINFSIDNIEPDTQVLIIDTESRHLTSLEAYQVVYEVVKKCINIPVKIFYKKTDSALRGHIGCELAALHDALNKQIHFVPAFPSQGRTTVNGIQFIHNVPLANTMFHHDPLNPIHSSNVADILKIETHLSIKNVSIDDHSIYADDIIIYDSIITEDLQNRLSIIYEQNHLIAVAGCAGFAECIADFISPICQDIKVYPDKTDLLCVICGSLTDVSKKQLEYAAKFGAKRITLTTEQKFEKNSLTSINVIPNNQLDPFSSSGEKIICIDVLGKNVITEALNYAAQNNIQAKEIPSIIALRLCEITHELILTQKNISFLIIGGDTLYSLFKYLKYPKIELLGEPISGMVLMKITLHGTSLQLLSKSGGFGSDHLIIDASKIILK